MKNKKGCTDLSKEARRGYRVRKELKELKMNEVRINITKGRKQDRRKEVQKK